MPIVQKLPNDCFVFVVNSCNCYGSFMWFQLFSDRVWRETQYFVNPDKTFVPFYYDGKLYGKGLYDGKPYTMMYKVGQWN